MNYHTRDNIAVANLAQRLPADVAEASSNAWLLLSKFAESRPERERRIARATALYARSVEARLGIL